MRGVNSTTNQSELEVNTCNRRKEQGTITFGCFSLVEKVAGDLLANHREK